MTSGPESASPSDSVILQLAVEHGLMNQADLESLTGSENGSLCDEAIATSAVSAADVQLMRPLASPSSYLPGYEFQDLIGQGATGAVYRARHQSLNRTVAIKLLKQTAAENRLATTRSQLEAQAGARMQHPNIVTVYDSGVVNGRVYLTMEYVTGTSLLKAVQANPMPTALALQVTRQIIHALQHAAEQKIIHRDIKPANLLLTESSSGLQLPAGVPAVKVLDFGLAFQADMADEDRPTADGAMLGTPCYMAPEQVNSSRVDERADIYGTGATLFHMLTGEAPFDTANAMLALAAKLEGDESWRNRMDEESIPEPVRQLVLEMTHHDPEQRLSSYAEVLSRLDSLLSELPPPHDMQISLATEPGGQSTVSDQWPTISAPEPESADPTGWKRIAAVVLFLALAVTAALVFSRPVPSKELPLTVLRRHFVFDGLSTPQARLSGAWKPGRDLENAPVLAGLNGWIQFQRKSDRSSPAFLRFQSGVNPLEKSSADIRVTDEDGTQGLIVRITEDKIIADTGIQSGDEFRPDGYAQGLRFDDSGSDGPRYRSVLITHQPGAWFVDVDGRRVGAFHSELKSPQVVTLFASGTVHFENLQFTDVEPTK